MAIDLHAEWLAAQQALVVGRGRALTFLEAKENAPRPNAEGYVQIQRDIAIHAARCALLKDDSLERYARWEKETAARQERFQNRATVGLIVLGAVAFVVSAFQCWVAYQVYAHPSPSQPQVIRAEVPAPPASQSRP